jgi:hypothetical protein
LCALAASTGWSVKTRIDDLSRVHDEIELKAMDPSPEFVRSEARRAKQLAVTPKAAAKFETKKNAPTGTPVD